MNLFDKMYDRMQAIHAPIQYNLKGYKNLVQQINQYHQGIADLSDGALQLLFRGIKGRMTKEADLENELVPIYAIIKEACFRTLKLRVYDVQLIAAIGLHYRKLVEMQTGEGKTLAAVFPSILNSLLNKGVHVLTFNDYLAKRDALWMKPVFDFFDIKVGYIEEGMSLDERKKAYNLPITYATAKTVGFDYLRCFIAYEENEIPLRPFNYAIVDEADAILIDEARNPLVLAGNMFEFNLDFYKISDFVSKLIQEVDFEFNAETRNIYLNETGYTKVEHSFSEDLYKKKNQELLGAINMSLTAHHLLTKGIDYIIKDGKIKLIDEFTGRIVEDRKWRNGLQTAVEAKEGLTIQSEGSIINSITIQHFLQKYPKIAGMTATAVSSSEEFMDFYGMETVVIPPNKVNRRVDHPDLIFTTKKAKEKALIEKIKVLHKKRQPILIGTLTVNESEALARKLLENNLDCTVLNARNDQEEAEIIKKAGELGSITISTNMAGRGTDIKLGGNNPQEKERVIQLGGLFVIGTNRHESLRIDRQLRGRAGRQGDPGASQFFVSLEDDLMSKYKIDEILPKKYQKLQGDHAIELKGFHKYLDITQGIIEKSFYDLRKALCLFTDLIEVQRKLFQVRRQQILYDPNQLDKLISDNYWRGKVPKDTFSQLKEIILYQFDKFWSDHLNYLSQLREGIYIVQFGGQKPLFEYQKQSDDLFQNLLSEFDAELDKIFKLFAEKPSLNSNDLGMKKPSSTWTYIINDRSFGNHLAMTLLDNSNTGLMVDPVSATMIFFHALFERFKKKKDK